jgi:N-methylhydantoinase A
MSHRTNRFDEQPDNRKSIHVLLMPPYDHPERPDVRGSLKVAFDAGGTFTDVILLQPSGDVVAEKVLSLWPTLGTTVSSLVARVAGAFPASGTDFVHATTLAANAILEGNLAPTGLITTRGFRDDLEMRAQRRPNIFDVGWERLPPLIPRRLRVEEAERIRSDGRIETPLDASAARQTVQFLLDAGVHAIAVSLINSYVNPTHERLLKEIISAMAPGVKIAISSDVHREIGEYERASTTVINACLMPMIEDYLTRLVSQLGTSFTRLAIMQSNGGITTASNALKRPAYIIESGPAAGVLAAARLAVASQFENVLSFDMGGTTAKACFIESGEPLEKPRGEIGGGVTSAARLFGGGGHALRVPSFDIVEVGAGGGSIAWVDSGGLLRIGPQSAGANPGPACYGRGGTEPTVTDANVVLGYINPEAIAGSAVRLSLSAAREALQSKIADRLGLDLDSAAFGIFQVANTMMLRALRAVSTERGRDPRTSVLIAFGGAGPLHAASLAESLQIQRVCVPRHAGVFSAVGLLLADYRHDEVRSLARNLNDVEPSLLADYWSDMETSAIGAMQEQGIPRSSMTLQYLVDMKYGFQLDSIAVASTRVQTKDFRSDLAAQFRRVHETTFGYVSDDPIEIVNLRLRIVGTSQKPSLAELTFGAEATSSSLRDSSKRSPRRRPAYFGDRGTLNVPVISRAQLGEGGAGPIIVEEPDTTILIPPGWVASLDGLANVEMYRTGVPA